MKAVMLAAGVGRRLYGDENDNLPKALLEFDGHTLFERHVPRSWPRRATVSSAMPAATNSRRTDQVPYFDVISH
ncbi:MAG TPA: hypothetical protein VF987_06110, partial [Rhodospirillales bacterium]